MPTPTLAAGLLSRPRMMARAATRARTLGPVKPVHADSKPLSKVACTQATVTATVAPTRTWAEMAAAPCTPAPSTSGQEHKTKDMQDVLDVQDVPLAPESVQAVLLAPASVQADAQKKATELQEQDEPLIKLGACDKAAPIVETKNRSVQANPMPCRKKKTPSPPRTGFSRETDLELKLASLQLQNNQMQTILGHLWRQNGLLQMRVETMEQTLYHMACSANMPVTGNVCQSEWNACEWNAGHSEWNPRGPTEA